MKKKYNSILAIVLFSALVLAASCTNLEEDLVGEITSDVKTEGVIGGDNGGSSNDALGAPYNQLLVSGIGSNSGFFPVQGLPSDEMVVAVKGGGWFDGGVWLQLHQHEWTSTHQEINSAWNQQYTAITECNTALASNLDANATAQIKVLRAYFYYRLLDLFGNVKLVTETNANPPQSTRTEVFNFVESEILDALGIVGVTPTMDLSSSDLTTEINPYRVNQYAALGLLAKLYLNAEVFTGTPRYQESADAASYVIDNSGYILADDNNYVKPNLGRRPSVESDPVNLTGYAALFAPNNGDNPEMIWSIPFDKATGRGLLYGIISLHYGSQFTYNFQYQPWNGFAALEEFYNMYDDTDARKKANFLVGPQLDANGATILDYGASDGNIELNYTPFINELTPNSILNAGARFNKFSYEQLGLQDMSNDVPIIRLGEMYLIRAEATARALNDWSLALSDVNTIRARSGVAALNTITADEFFDERGREMFLEVTRRQDMIRFDKYNDAGWEKPASEAFRNLFPIPDAQIQAGAGTLTQNPGY